MRRICVAAFAALLSLPPAPGDAQQGAGTAGGAVLQLAPGGRAAAFSGAYAAQTGDADVLFYNPAGIAALDRSAAFSYLRYAQDIAFGSAAATFRVGGLSVGASAAFLDAGTVVEIVPDPDYGGERGKETGRTVSAGETSLRLGAGLPVGDRFRIGAAFGLVSSDLAGASRSAPAADVGAQLSLSRGVVAVSVRNLGGALSGQQIADARLPTEVRLGTAFGIDLTGALGLRTSADLVHSLREGGTQLLIGAEGGLLSGTGLGAVGRLGYAAGEAGLGALRLGAGVTIAGIAADYTFQHLEYLGPVHRLGVRWTGSD